jgi:hypothetical protein
MVKPTLKNEPSDYALKTLLVNFQDSKPLTPDQLNFLYQYEKALSGPLLDPIIKYYLKHYFPLSHHSFLLPSEVLNRGSIEQLKRRLNILLKNKGAHVRWRFSPEQFNKFREIAHRELILFHGNQFLTGAPFHPGGIPYTIYFQWGNLFGVAKYVVLPDERAMKSNVLIYIEDMLEKPLIECIYKYNHDHAEELNKLTQVMPVPQPREEPAPIRSPYAIPTLSLSRGTEKNKDEK